jgi:peptidoglycan/LPS O-acetylase OafA/YrhL
LRFEQITFTRFIAAISVVVFHVGLSIYPFSSSNLNFIFGRANIAVSYFFILSGFIMIIAYNKSSKIKILDFYKNRIARIYPVFIISVLLMALFFFFIEHFRELLAYNDSFLCLSGIQAWIPQKALVCNFPSWSLSVELFFYALFPLLYNKVYQKVPLKIVAAFIIVFWVISQVFFYKFTKTAFFAENLPATYNFALYFPLMHLNQFLMGNLGGLFFVRYLYAKQGKYDLHILFCLVLFYLSFKYPTSLDYHNGLLAVLFIPIIILIVLNTGFITKIFQLKPFVFLGEISYSIYILQWPLWLWVNKSLEHYQIVDKTVVFYIYILILIAFSSLCCVLIEKPITRWLKNKRQSLKGKPA